MLERKCSVAAWCRVFWVAKESAEFGGKNELALLLTWSFKGIHARDCESMRLHDCDMCPKKDSRTSFAGRFTIVRDSQEHCAVTVAPKRL